MADHEFGVVPHDWFSLHVEITQHFVTTPVSNKYDDVIVQSGTEECHSAFCPKGPRRDILIRESQIGSHEEFDRGHHVGRDHSGGHVYPTSPRRLETGERSVYGGTLLSEECYLLPQGLLWA